MGQSFKGTPARQTGVANLQTPEQQQFLKQLMTLSPEAMGAFPQLLSGFSEENFQKGILEPTMRNYERSVLPAIQQRFVDANAGDSSALNQALTQSAEDLSNVLAGQRIGYEQMTSGNQLQAINQLLNLLNIKGFEPIVQGPQQGWASQLIPAAATLGAGAIMASSEKVKDNIRDYNKGLGIVKQLKVKMYDYTMDVLGKKTDRVGLIAENVPEEIRDDLDGVKAVDLYGLVGILVNAIQELEQKIEYLEAKHGNSV